MTSAQMPPTEAEMPTSTTIPLKGLEKVMVMSETTGATIAHVAAVRGNIDLLVEHADRAWREVHARHPKMRAKLGSEPHTAVVASSIPETSIRVLVTQATSPTEWGSIVEDRCNVYPVDRKGTLPFALHILRASPAEAQDTARLILYSDHWASDGFSGLRVIHDFLTAAVRDTSGEDLTTASITSLPILAPSIDLFFQKTITPGFSLFPYLANFFAGFQMRKFRSVFSLSPSLTKVTYPMQSTQTRALFASGTPENLAAALKRCKEEGTTLHGAFLAALAAVFATCPKALKNNNKKVAFSIDHDFNLRKRLTPPLGDDHVGNFIGINSLPEYASGIDLATPFWEHARAARKSTIQSLNNSQARMMFRIFDNYFFDEKSTAQALAGKENPVIGDVNFSNLGRYMFPTIHTFPSSASNDDSSIFEIEHLNFYNSLSGIGPATVLFISSVKTLDYTIAHRIDDTVGQAFFDNVVKAFEAVGSVTKEETIASVVDRILGGVAQASKVF
ncbi:hypothetical protein DFJ77DRAFT_437669 [Powellomyces hirtus]|nr:hypothetical protein DFJ77DRAFT_437669 [Powellomyces hirtus]